jgi:hypothetical protein
MKGNCGWGILLKLASTSLPEGALRHSPSPWRKCPAQHVACTHDALCCVLVLQELANRLAAGDKAIYEGLPDVAAAHGG